MTETLQHAQFSFEQLHSFFCSSEIPASWHPLPRVHSVAYQALNFVDLTEGTFSKYLKGLEGNDFAVTKMHMLSSLTPL
jgi:hypothetical protein